MPKYQKLISKSYFTFFLFILLCKALNSSPIQQINVQLNNSSQFHLSQQSIHNLTSSLYNQPQIQNQQETKQSSNQQNQEQQTDIDADFQKLNFLISTYFDNCTSIDKQSNLLEKCSIQRSKFSQFLYAFFYKQILTSFLYYYQKQNPQGFQMANYQAKGQQIRQLAVSAYQQWIQIYFPNKRIQIQQFYYVMNEIQESVLQVIQHIQKFNILSKVMRQVQNITLSPKQYLSQGDKSDEQIQSDISLFYAQSFDNQCQFPHDCKMTSKRFVYFVKNMAFYMIPIKQEWKKDNGKVLIDSNLDYQVTKFLIKEVEALKKTVGQEIEYSQIKQYTFVLTEKLFEHLIEESQKNKSLEQNRDQKQNESQFKKDVLQLEQEQIQAQKLDQRKIKQSYKLVENPKDQQL